MVKGAGLAAVVLLGVLSCGHHTKMAQYRDARDGWTVAYPASMHRVAVADYEQMVSWRGIMIANSDEVKKSEAGYFRRFPPDGAAFGMLQMGGGPGPDLSGPEARFPLSRSQFRYDGSSPPPRPHVYGMIANGTPWAVYTWFGPKASRADQERIWRIAESLRFPPQRPGTVSGDFYVMHKASHYPLGAVVKFPGRHLPRESSYVPAFYLVHAPGGMYAVGWPPKFERTCHMGFDRKRSAFFCSTRRGWWSRVGEPLVEPLAGQLPDDGLMLGQAKIGRDGQVLVGNWTVLGGPQFKQYERRFWSKSR
jgi:hypothetical protein